MRHKITLDDNSTIIFYDGSMNVISKGNARLLMDIIIEARKDDWNKSDLMIAEQLLHSKAEVL